MGHYFTYITGVITILAFILQIRDVFPQHREARRTLLLLITGIFMGSIFGSVNAFDITIKTAMHPLALLLLAVLALLVIGIVIVLLIAVTSSAYERREELYGLAGIGMILFFVIFIIAGVTFGVTDGPKNQEPLSNNELIALTAFYIEKKDFEMALNYLEQAKFRYEKNDPRRAEIEKQIIELKDQMAKDISSKVKR